MLNLKTENEIKSNCGIAGKTFTALEYKIHYN